MRGGLILLMILATSSPPIAAGALSREEVQRTGLELLRTVGGQSFSDADRRFVAGKIAGMKAQSMATAKKEALYQLEKMAVVTETAEPALMPANPENEPAETAEEQIGCVGTLKTDNGSTSCTPTSEVAKQFLEMQRLAKGKSRMPKDKWVEEMVGLQKTLEAAPRTFDVLRLRIESASLLAEWEGERALATIRRADLEYRHVWSGGLLFLLSALPDSEITVNGNISVEGLYHFLGMRFSESNKGLRHLATHHGEELAVLLDSIPDEHAKVVLQLLFLQSIVQGST